MRTAYAARSGALVWLPSDATLNRVLAEEPEYQELLAAMGLTVKAVCAVPVNSLCFTPERASHLTLLQ